MTDLRSARKSAGLVQTELGAKTGLGQSDISDLERGEVFMTKSVAQRLARHLPGASPDELVIGNLMAGFKRAAERRDRIEVLRCAQRAVKYAEDNFDTTHPDLAAALDTLTNAAFRISEAAAPPSPGHP